MSSNCFMLAVILPWFPCSYVLDQILSGQALDELIEKVLNYLLELKKDIEEDKVPREEYVITKVILSPLSPLIPHSSPLPLPPLSLPSCLLPAVPDEAPTRLP